MYYWDGEDTVKKRRNGDGNDVLGGEDDDEETLDAGAWKLWTTCNRT